MPDGTVSLKERRGYGGESPAMKVGTWRGRRRGRQRVPRYPREGGKKEGVPALGCAGRRPVPPRSLRGPHSGICVGWRGLQRGGGDSSCELG